jgi:hypothetical protein
MTQDQSNEALAAISAWSTLATAVVATAAFVVAWIFGSGQVREAREARNLTKRLDIERSRPYVVAFMEASEASEQIVNLVIKNFGLTAARDVQVKINPWPERSNMSEDYRKVGVPSPLPILAPGQSWQTIWDTSVDRRRSQLPDSHSGSISYDGLEGTHIVTEFVLDWSIFESRMHTEIKTIHHAAKSLRAIQKSLLGFQEGIHGGIKVFVRDGDAKDRHSAADRIFWQESPNPSQPSTLDD